MSEKKYPSFRLQNGREPVSGQDYSAEGTLCQDDFEYFTGTGLYTNDPAQVTADERIARETRVYYTGDQSNLDGEGTVTKVTTGGRFYPLTYDIKMDDGRIFPAVLPNSFQDAPGRRFWILAEWEEKRQAQFAAFADRYGLTLQQDPPYPVRELPSRYKLLDDE